MEWDTYDAYVRAQGQLGRPHYPDLHFRDQLSKCPDYGVCFCKYGRWPKGYKRKCSKVHRILQEAMDIRSGNPYASWTCRDLRAAIKQRSIILPKYSVKQTMVHTLEQADTECRFRFIDLPPELRILIYEFALCDDDTNPPLHPNRRAELQNPALLQTCHQIYQEASLIFFRKNRFEFRLKLNWKKDLWVPFRFYLNASHMKDLRHICFSKDYFEIQINLADSALEKWLIPFGTQKNECPCKRKKRWNLAQWRDKVKPHARFLGYDDQKMQYMEHFDDQVRRAAKDVEKFQALCGTGNDVQPSPAGIWHLASAADRILEERWHWKWTIPDLSG